jgi:hypothetical protein
MNSAPSASDIADVPAWRASVLLLRVRFIAISFSMIGTSTFALQNTRFRLTP